MHGIGEYRFADGKIYKGSWANHVINGMGLYWFLMATSIKVIIRTVNGMVSK